MSQSDPPMTDATAILVLGMHRSGTSATTRVLNLLGAELSPHLLEAQADNEKGFWEHAEAVQIHEELLAALGRTWHDVREMPEDWLQRPASYAAIDKIARLIRRDFAGNTLWAVKDPRMCRLVPLWKEALRRTGVRAVALIVVRKPGEVANSLHAREGWSEAHSDLMWTQYSLEAIRYTHDIPRSVISYDDLLADWRSAVAHMGEDLGVVWPCQDDDASRQIDAFLSPEDRHHRASDEDSNPVEPTGPLSIPEQLYALCADVAKGRASWSALEQFDSRYREAASLYRGVAEQKYALDELALERINHIRLIERELQSVANQAAQFSSLATERNNHIELLAAQHQLIIDVASARQVRIDELEQAAADRDEKLRSLNGELKATRTRLQSVASELLAVRTKVAGLSSEHGWHITDVEAPARRADEFDDAPRPEQPSDVQTLADLDQLREHCEELSAVFELTFNRRWLLRRLWDVTRKRFTLRRELGTPG